MHILMLSWEYPLVCRWLARQEDLAETMAEQNCSVHVITTGSADLPARETVTESGWTGCSLII